MSLVIGLTGSIATGKSTIANMFKELNIDVIDADLIAKEVVEINKPAYLEIVKEFGEKVLYENKELNRKALGHIVFNDEKYRKKLNKIVHPAIRQEMLKQKNELIEQNPEAIVMDIPLIYESGLEDYVEKILVVYVTEETQLKRLMERDNSTKEEALSRIASQISIEEKAKRADAIINNNGTIEESYEQLKSILKKWNINI